MNPFLCVVDLAGGAVGVDALTAALPAHGQGAGQIEVALQGSWAGAWVPSDTLRRPWVINRRGVLALGNVRITNRRDVGPADADPAQDLELVVDHYLRHGTAGFRDLVGDFAVILWDQNRRRVVAARDGLGIKALFYQRNGDRIAIGSHLDCFETAGYDRGFIGQFLVGLPRGTSRTIFREVTRLTPGSWLTADLATTTVQSYWQPAEFTPARSVANLGDTKAAFRELFTEAVRAQMDDGLPVWSQLSGGLDSSSVVGMASTLAGQGRGPALAGTLSVVDSLSEGDETPYSNAVAAMWGVRNERVENFAAWQPDELGIPSFAEPRAFLPFYARDRAMARTVRDAGGRVMLSGFGSDNYLSCPDDFLADLLAQGRVGEALSRLTEFAVNRRRSFWGLAAQHAVGPIAPEWLRRRLVRQPESVPAWVNPALAAEFGLAEWLERRGPKGGQIVAEQVAIEMGSVDVALERGVFEEGLEIRYPFLHRPLVEFGMRLPVELRVGNGRQKWILREALGDLLPARVRNREGKGAIDGRIVWSLNHHAKVLERLIADSHLADLGCISRERFAAAYQAARRGNSEAGGLLFLTLSLETWLAVRSGWWQRYGVSLPAHDGLAFSSSPSNQEQDHAEAHVR